MNRGSQTYLARVYNELQRGKAPPQDRRPPPQDRWGEAPGWGAAPPPPLPGRGPGGFLQVPPLLHHPGYERGAQGYAGPPQGQWQQPGAAQASQERGAGGEWGGAGDEAGKRRRLDGVAHGREAGRGRGIGNRPAWMEGGEVGEAAEEKPKETPAAKAPAAKTPAAKTPAAKALAVRAPRDASERPPAPSGWEWRLSSTWDRYYLHNDATDESRWTPPASPAPAAPSPSPPPDPRRPPAEQATPSLVSEPDSALAAAVAAAEAEKLRLEATAAGLREQAKRQAGEVAQLRGERDRLRE
ncbi:hypothetical protein TeGR_g3326, partial [Tetraparma gracilis]